MQNLDIIEGVYNNHIECALQLFGIDFEFDKAGHITVGFTND